MIISLEVADRILARLQDPWHLALAYCLVVPVIAPDLVAAVTLGRCAARAVQAKAPVLGALSVAAALGANTPPRSQVVPGRPVAARYRLAAAPRGPRPLPVVWTAPVRADQPAVVSAARTAVLAPSRGEYDTAPARGPARVVRPSAPGAAIGLGPAELERVAADLVIAPAIRACRDTAGSAR